MRLGDRLRLQAAVDRVVRAAKREPLLGPESLHDGQLFLEARPALGEVDAVERELVRLVADGHAEDGAPVRHHVEHGHVLGEPHRMMERRHRDVGAQEHARGARGEAGEDGERRRPVVIGDRVVLLHPHGIEAELLRPGHLLQRLAVVVTALDGNEADLQPGHDAVSLARPAADGSRRCRGAPGATIARHERRVHPRRARPARALLHESRWPRLRARQPPRGRQGRALRPLLALAEVAPPPVSRRVSRSRSPRRGAGRAPAARRARRAPSSSTTGSSWSTATTPWPSWAACTWRARGPRTSSPRCWSGAGSWRISSSRPATFPTTTARAGDFATTCRRSSRGRSARATSRRWTARSRRTPRGFPACATSTRRASRGTPASRRACIARPSAPRRWTPCAGSCPRRPSPTWASSAPARGTSSSSSGCARRRWPRSGTARPSCSWSCARSFPPSCGASTFPSAGARGRRISPTPGPPSTPRPGGSSPARSRNRARR